MAAAEPTEPRALRRSDVVFMYDDPKVYEAYGCTVLGWAGWSDARHIEAAHAKGVRHFSSSVGFLTEFAGVIDFSPDFLDAACRTFEGKPFTVPWLWDHKHKGQPAYWWCTNSPLYRRYLFGRLEKTMAAKPDGLHIDDYRGTAGSVTWLAGGFCRHCLAAFREYLGKQVPKETLAALGITDLAAFDYRQFLLDRGVTPGDYPKRRASLPLAAEFHRFHVTANTDFVAEYRRRAEQLRGQPVTLCVNSGLDDPQGLVIAPHVSYFCCEVGHGADRREPARHPVYIYKLADGLDRPVASTAGGHDWAFVHEHKVYGLVRSWIALSYALGHHFMAPHRQWCYTEKKGTHWTTAPPEEYAPLYRFVREHERLFDGYEAVAPVAVVYSNAANRAGRARIEALCLELAQANTPFAVLVAGDEWLPHRLDAARLARFRAVAVPKDADLDPEQKKLLDPVAAEGRLVAWPDPARLAQLVPAPIVVQGAEHVWAFPRAIPGDPKAPVVVHLLNRNYDKDKDAPIAQRELTVRLRRDLFGGRAFARAALHAPKTAPLALDLRTDAESTTVKVPALDLWAVVELSP